MLTDLGTGTDYAGSADISSTIKTKLLSQFASYTSTKQHAKATAYMLDTTQWAVFKDSSGYASYAIGGPTLELFKNSYNATHTRQIVTAVGNSTLESGNIGYSVSWSDVSGYDTSTNENYLNINDLDTSESLYILNDTDKAQAYWLASPSIAYSNNLGGVRYMGQISMAMRTNNGGLGMRPVVVLNSNVKLGKLGNNEYKIVGNPGLVASQSINYAWSTSNTTEPTSWSTLSLENSAGATSVSKTITGSGYNGTYYLWIKPNNVTDREGNVITASVKTGAFKFDNTIPAVTVGNYVTDGLLLHVSGHNNTGYGHGTSTTWRNLTDNSNGIINGATLNDTYMTFDGTNDWVNFGEMSVTNAVTLEVTFDANTIQTGEVGVLANAEDGGVAITLQDGKPTFRIFVNGVQQTAQTAQVTTNTKYHITGTYDGSTLKLYKNGELQLTKSVSGSIDATTLNTVMAIGVEPIGNGPEYGFANIDVYSARVYNKALTQAQVQQNIKAEENTTWSKTSSVPVRIADKVGGVASGASISYAWSTSGTTAPSSWTPATLSYTAGATNPSFTATSSGLTGKYYLWVKLTTLKDVAGNTVTSGSTIRTLGTYYLDNELPTMSVSPNTNTTAKQSHEVTVTLGDSPSGLATGQQVQYAWTTSNSATPSSWSTLSFSNSAGAASATNKITGSGYNGTYYLWVKASNVIDLAGNTITTTQTTSAFSFDNTGPTVTIAANPNTSPTNASSITYTFTFSDNVTGFTADDVTVTNGTPGTFSGSGKTYTLVVNYVADGNQTVSIAADKCTDALGNGNQASATKTVTIDRTAPTVTITANPSANPTSASSITYTFKFSENVTGFTADDVTVTNGTPGTFSGSGTTYTLVVTNSGSCTQSVSVAASKCTDSAGNGNTASATKSVTIDRTGPTVTITASPSANPTNASSITYTFTFSENVTGFTADDVTVTNGTPGTFNGSGKTYTLVVSYVADGNQSVSVAASKCTDALGNGNQASSTKTVTMDRTAPTVTITANPSANPTSASSITYTFTFSENVTGFTADDVTITNGTPGTFSGGGKTYTLVVTNSGSCSQSVSVSASKCIDTAENGNAASATKTVTIDRTGPTVTITANPSASPTNASSITYTFTFSEAVKDFVADDITVTNGTKGTFSGSGSTYTLVVTNSGSCTQSVSVAAGKCTDTPGNGNIASATKSVVIDRTAPTITASPTSGAVVKNRKVTLTVAETGGSILSTSNSYQYYLSTSSTALSGGAWTNYTSGTEFTIGTNLTGTYYLFVKTVSDAVGNVSSANGTITAVSTVNYHRFGSYIFDNTAPTKPTYHAYFSADNSTYTSGTWTNSEVRTTISSTDANSGVTKIQYSSDKSTWSDLGLGVSGGIQVSGTTYSGTENWSLKNRNDTFYFRAVDAVGNASEASEAYNIRYDITKPTAPTYQAFYNSDSSRSYTSGTWTNSQVNTTITSTDASSGVSYIQYSTDQTNWSTFKFSTSGGLQQSGTSYSGTEQWSLKNRNDTFYFRAVDIAGNISDLSSSYNIKYDINAPTVTVTPASSTVSKSKSVTITLADTGNSELSATTGQYYLSTSATALTGGSWTNYTSGTAFTIGTNLNGTYYLFVKTVTDTAGNVSSTNGTITTVSSVNYHRFGTYVFDNTGPTVTITADPSANPTNASSITYTFTFSESVTGFEANDITVTNGTPGAFSGSGTTYTLVVTNSGSCEQTVSVAAGAATDVSGNGNQTGSISKTIDRTAPTVTITANPSANPTNAHSITYTFTFSEDVYEFVADDVTVINGAKGTFSGSGKTYTLVVTNTGNCIQSVSVAANKCKDSVGNGNTASVTKTVNIDTTAPTMSLNPNTNATAKKSHSTTLTVQDSTGVTSGLATGTKVQYAWSQSNITEPTSWTTAEISNTAGASSATTTLSGSGYNGTYYLWVKASSVKDTVENTSTQVITSGAFIFDNQKPTLTITADKSSPTNASSITYTFEFDENVTGFDETDISVENGVLGTFTTVEAGRKYTLVVTNTGSCVQKVNVAAGVAQDVAGNTNAATSSQEIQIDRTALAVDITANKTSPTNSSSITYTFEFNKAVTGFTAGDITVTNGEKGTFSGSGTTYTLVVTNSGTCEQTVNVVAGAATDSAGNTSEAASKTIVIDRNTPTITLTPNTNGIQAKTNNVEVSIDDVGAGLTTGTQIQYAWSQSNSTQPSSWTPVNVSNQSGATNAKTTVNGAGYDGTYYLWVKPVQVKDLAGNSNTQAIVSGAFVFDNTRPTLDITADKTSPTNANSITYTFTFSESVSGFDASDITVTNGNKGTFSGSGATYTLVVNYVADGTQTVTVAENKATDTAGNQNTGDSISIDIDITNPITSITADKTSPTNANSITYTITFDETVTGFDASDITVTNGTKGTFTTVETGRTYTLVVTFVANGEQTVSVAAGVAQDDSGNTNTAASKTITMDKTLPTLTIEPNTNTTPKKSHSTTVKLADIGTGLQASSQIQYAWSQSNSEEPTSWTTLNLENASGVANVSTTISASSLTGTYYLWVKPLAVLDLAGNTSTEVKTSGAFLFDNKLPTLEITANTVSPTNANNIIYTFTFSENVTGFIIDDVSVTNGTKGEFAGSGSTYTLEVEYVSDGNQVVSVAAGVAQDTAENLNESASKTIVIDRTAPTVTITPNKTSPTNAETISYTLQFSEGVTGVNEEAISVTNGVRGTITKISDSKYTVEVGYQADGEQSLTISNNKVNDLVGNTFAGAQSTPIVIDRTLPTITISPNENETPKQSHSATIILQDSISSLTSGAQMQYAWSQNNQQEPATWTTSNFGNAQGANTTNTTVTGAGYNGTYYLWVRTLQVGDIAGNTLTQTKVSGAFEFDNGGPTVTFTPNEGTWANSHTTTVQVEDTYAGVNAESLKYQWTQSTTTPTEESFTQTFTNGTAITKPNGEGRWYLWVIAKDNSQPANTSIIRSGEFLFDNTAPVVSFELNGNTKYEKSHSTTVTVTDNMVSLEGRTLKYKWTQNINEPQENEFTETFTNGSAITKIDGNDGWYLWILAKDDAGNTVKSVSNVFNFDNIAPTLNNLQITNPSSGTYKAGQTITIEATFSENIYGNENMSAVDSTTAPTLNIKLGDGTEKQATFSSVEGNKIIYTYTLEEGDNGAITATNYTGTVYDRAGNSLAVQVLPLGGSEITVDTVLPTITITANQTSPTKADSISYIFTFSEPVTGFDISDISVTNGTKGEFTGSGTTYTLIVNTVADGNQIINIAKDVSIDIAGNGNTAATNTILIDRTRPTLIITSSETSPTSANSITYTFTFSEPVTGFEEEDITVEHGEKSTFTQISDSKYTLVVTNSENCRQTISVADGIALDAALNENKTASITITVDHTPPTVTLNPNENATVKQSHSTTVTIQDGANALSAEEIAALTEAEKKNIYGATVTNYNPTNGVNSAGIKWRVLHSDGNNIYLIADDYVPISYVPTGKGTDGKGTNGTAVSPHQTYPKAFSVESYKDYYGISDIDSKLLTKLFSQYTAVGNTNLSAKVVAYLMDTVMWGGFKDSIYADYAIGAPTIELFRDSYNAIHDTEIQTQVVGDAYLIKWSTDESYVTTITDIDHTDNLYIIQELTDAYGMKLASPGNGATTVLGAGARSNLLSIFYKGESYGARPVISLKSGMELEEQADGTYKIVSNLASGLAEEQQIQYAWSTSNEQEPSSWTTVNLENEEGVSSTTTTLTGSGYNGAYYLWVKPVHVEDTVGNIQTQATVSGEFLFDNQKPQVTITAINTSDDSEIADITNADTIKYTFTFDEPVTEFDTSDISVTNGTKGEFTGSGTTYTLIVNTVADGNQIIQIENNACIDVAENGNVAASRTILIDQTPPTLTITSSELNPTKADSIAYTFTFSESVTGFDTSDIQVTNGTKGLFSGSGDTYTLIVTNTETTEQSINVSAGVAQDAAKNLNESASISITIDHTPPTVTFEPNGNETPEKSQTTEVTVIDTGSNTGLNTSSFKYVWTENIVEPEDDAFTQSFVIDANNKTTITLKDIETGGRYLWIMAKDNLGNTSKTVSNVFMFDNQKPTIQVTPDKLTPADEKIAQTIITAQDPGGAGLASTNEYKYYLSSKIDAFEGGQEKTYQSGVAITDLGAGLTGTYYLFVKQVSDESDNLSETAGTQVTINGAIWHRFGEYLFDNEAPIGGGAEGAIFGTNGNTTWAQEHSTTVTLADTPSGLNESTFKYLWTRSAVAPTKAEFESKNNTFTNGATISTTEDGEVGESRKSGDDWRLWIYAEDNLGHALITSTNPFYLDNLKPIITAVPNENPAIATNENVVKQLNVTINVYDPVDPTNSDNLSGLKANSVYKYYLSTSSTQLVGGILSDYGTPGATITIGAGETGTRYLFARTVIDNANNESGSNLIQDDGANYQLIGTYIFDNTAPVVSFNPNGNTSKWEQEQITAVTVQDNKEAASVTTNASGDITANTNGGTGVAGVKATTVKYRWVQGTSTVLTTENFANGDERVFTTKQEVLATITENVSSTEIDETTLELKKTGDNWYLWIYAEDNLGNASVTRTAEPYKIDNTRPTITVTPESVAVCKNTSVTITALDMPSGLSASNEYKAYLSTSSTNLVNPTEIGYTSGATIENVGAGITGWRYLFVKTVKDNVDLESTQSGTIVTATDGNNYHVYGPYIFDNTAPEVSYNPNGNPTWSTTHTTQVTITENAYTPDAAVETTGEAGIKKEALKYVWRKASEGTPSKDQITETLVIEGTAETIDNTMSQVIEIERDITKNTDSDNDWLLWLYVEDTLGNSNIVSSNAFWFDNTNPTIETTATPNKTTDDNVWTNADVEIKVTETHSKLDDANNSYQYYLSTSDSALTSEAQGSIFGVPQSLTNYTLTEANEADVRTAIIQNLGNTETGTRYLFIKAVNDKTVDDKNESIGGTIVEIGGINYHRFGPYEFDNLAPKTVSFVPEQNDQNDTSYEKAQSTIVTIVDQGQADLNDVTFKYLWTKTSTEPTTTSFDSEYETATHKGTFTNGGTVTVDTETGNDWYIWISAEDKLGNRYVDGTGTFWLDNTKPTVDVTNINPESTILENVWKNADITITVTEEHAKLASDSIQYYLSTTDNALTSVEEGSPFGEPQVLNEIALTESNSTIERHATISKLGWNSTDGSKTGETGIRYLFIKVEDDKAGNISSERGTLVNITEGPYPGTYHRFGPYIFDNAPPQVEFNPDGSPIITEDPETKEWKQSYNIEVSVTEVGYAGIDTDELYYLWVENGSTPNISDFTNNLVVENQTEQEDVVTQVISHVNTPAGDTGDTWVLWILVKDVLGESNIVASETFQIDNALPVMQITTGSNPSINEICTSTDVTISFRETNSGLAEGADIGYAGTANSYQYYLSTSSTEIKDGKWFDYTKGTSFTIGQNDGNGNPITGRRYLFVKTIKDKAGNESNLSVSDNSNNTDTNSTETIIGTTETLEIDANLGTEVTINGVNNHRFGDIATIEGVNYHLFGEFIFDNTSPEIIIEYNAGEHDTYRQSQETTVTIRDNTNEPSRGEAGVNTSTLKYLWIKGNTTIANESAFNTAYNATTDNYRGEFTTLETTITSPEEETGSDWYLWILAKDNIGNTNIVTTNPFWLDNTNPTISANIQYPENEHYDSNGQIITTYADVTLVAADLNAGLYTETDPATIYQYYLSTNKEALEGSEWVTYQSGVTFRLGETLTDTTYLFVRKVTDKAGNESAWEDEEGNLQGQHGEITEIGTELYHLMGTFVFDNTAPYVTFNPEGEPEWAKSHATTVSVRDDDNEEPQTGLAGVSDVSLKYQWIRSTETPTEESFEESFTNGQTIARALGTGNDWILWILAKDKVGNTTIVKSDAFWLDNSAPVAQGMISKPLSATTYTLTISGIADNKDDIVPQSGFKGYYISADNTTPTESSDWILATSETVVYDEVTQNYTVTYEGATQLTTYYFWTIDNVGNISEPTTHTTKEIFYSVNHTSWYETLEQAVAGANENLVDTIYVLKDVTDSSNVTINKSVKLDTNGKTLTRTDSIVIGNNDGAEGNIEVIGTGILTSTSTTNPTISAHGGTVKLTSGTITSTGNVAIVTTNNGSVDIAGGTVSTTAENAKAAIAGTLVDNGQITISGGTVEGNIYASGTLNLNSGTVNGNVYGGSYNSNSIMAAILLEGATVNGNIYGGGEKTLEYGIISLASGTVNGSVYGGSDNSNSVVKTMEILHIGATIVGDLYGGGNSADKVEKTSIGLAAGQVRNLYGGGTNNSSVGSANILLAENEGDNWIVESGNIYGGPNTSGTVENATVGLLMGTVNNVYGGGTQGGTTLNTEILIAGTSTVTGNLYGGAHKSTVGNITNNSGSATINITGGTIKGNVYGGSDTDPLYGSTKINIGKEFANTEPVITVGGNDFGFEQIVQMFSTEIIIEGNIYGGGHEDKTIEEDEEDTENEEEEEEEEVNTDFTIVSVKNGTQINIDANHTDMEGNTLGFNFEGDIFGAGEKTNYEGNSSIIIKNLGTSGNPYLINSIQRTGTLTIDNSVLEIIGESDASNLNVDASYTLNRIGNFKIKNGTYLYLRRGFNLVEELNSVVDVQGTETKATVTVENGAVTLQNVDNRIYVYEGVNLYIAKGQYSKDQPIAEYGKVNGMTFFGMYTRDRSTSALKYDVYDPTNPIFTDTFILSSYVEGKYDSTQAITVDGFYTNALENKDDATSDIITKYVDVITAAPTYQDWMLGGEKVFTQEVTMVAQRNVERVYESIPLDYLNQPGAEYKVELFSVNSFEPDIELVSRTAIPRVAQTTNIANTTFALIMRNGSGWQNDGETTFHTSGTPIRGTTSYYSDYSGEAPYIDFYLYNSINITETRDCGFANLVFLVTQTTGDDASLGTKFKIAVSINVQTIGEIIEGEFQTDTRITDGINFGLFTDIETFITDRSSMTTYFNMYPLGLYDTTDYRVLSSTCALPIGTQITMVDYGKDEYKPDTYFYEVKEGDAVYEEESGRYIYRFTNFIEMSSLNGTSYFVDDNLTYSSSGYEEYRIVFDFKNVEITEDLLKQNVRFELRDGNTNLMKNYEIMPTEFNIYADQRSNLSLNVTKNSANVYDMVDTGELEFTIKSIMTTKSVEITSTIVDDEGNEIEETKQYLINDTFYDEKKLGMAISLYDSQGNRVPYDKVRGIYCVVDGQEYYPDLTGVIRWYLADNVVTVEKTVKMYIKGYLLDSGTYEIRIENFASDNGTYFGISGDNQDRTTIINMIDLEHGLKVEMLDVDRVIDAATGETHDGDTQMNIDITASDVVQNTNIRVSLYKRDITYNNDLTYAGISYSLVNLQSYVTNSLVTPETKSLNSTNSFEYLITDEVSEETLINLILNLKPNLLTGGYKLVFSLYSGDTYLGKVERHFVVTDIVGEPVTDTGSDEGSGSGSGTGAILSAGLLTATPEAAEIHYGGYVTNYKPTNGISDDEENGTKWRIFHSDGTNIYLIADDYIDRSYVPTGKGTDGNGLNGTPVKEAPAIYPKGFDLTTLVDYAGLSEINSNLAAKWLSQYSNAGYAGTNENMKKTAYLMDTTMWGGFKDSTFAEYAIGGPTIELLVASYNTIHEEDLDTQVTETGYQLKWISSDNYVDTITGLSGSLYLITEKTNAYGMWMPSPSNAGTSYVVGVRFDGCIGSAGYSGCGGVRPIVCLKSGTQIQLQENGTYKIVK